MSDFPPPPVPPAPPAGPGPQSYGEPPLDQPWYGAPFIGAWLRFWKKYVTFSGRASRSEFWWTVLANFIINTVLGILRALLGLPGQHIVTVRGIETMQYGPGALPITILIWLFGVAVIIPTLALYWRRLHDIDRSGWWVLLGLIPLVGAIILIVWFASRSRPEGARFDRH